MEPLLGHVAEAFAGRLRVVQVDTSADPELAARFKIRAVPTMLIFDKGVPVEFIVGTVPSRFVFETVRKALCVKYPTTVRRTRKASNWPSHWRFAFDATSI
jgi:thioredoxin-like negative regulator of GroEL